MVSHIEHAVVGVAGLDACLKQSVTVVAIIIVVVFIILIAITIINAIIMAIVIKFLCVIFTVFLIITVLINVGQDQHIFKWHLEGGMNFTRVIPHSQLAQPGFKLCFVRLSLSLFPTIFRC